MRPSPATAGGFMGLFRFARCGPGGTHGVDLVPERLDPAYVWYMPWRYWAISRKKPGTDGES
jgi:putative component of membrane protein insertase Oxa1/YidC/SpoIIIJ protein YidD